MLRISDVAVLALELIREAELPRRFALLARHSLKDDLARLPKGLLHGIHYARALIGTNDDAVGQHEDRLPKVDIQQRLGGSEFKDLSVLKQPAIAAPPQIEQPLLEGRIVGQPHRNGL